MNSDTQRSDIDVNCAFTANAMSFSYEAEVASGKEITPETLVSGSLEAFAMMSHITQIIVNLGKEFDDTYLKADIRNLARKAGLSVKTDKFAETITLEKPKQRALH
tara:strand:+ start:2017 stop:2334 length:318 start_codon:yes stop_codon:yes gene_type:complete